MMKPLYWVGSSRKDLKRFPEPVQDVMGRSLLGAQFGAHPDNAKALRGFGGAGVLEIVEDHDGDTFRAVYTVRFRCAVYVLHAFQKKSKRGRETPRHEIGLVHERLRAAEADYLMRTGN
jgi:phage-related protein